MPFKALGARPDAIRELLRAHGIALVTGVPVPGSLAEGDALLDGMVRANMGFPRETFWGTFWDTAGERGQGLTEEGAPVDTAYTAEALDVHTDCTYLRDPPQLQVFLSVAQLEEGQGGESVWVDGPAPAPAPRS